MDEKELNKILIEVDSFPGSSDIVKKHSIEMEEFKEKLLKYMDEYRNNDIDMSFEEWIDIKFRINKEVVIGYIQKRNIMVNFFKNYFKDLIMDNINEFEDLSLELTVGWVNYNG